MPKASIASYAARTDCCQVLARRKAGRTVANICAEPLSSAASSACSLFSKCP
jgi:hypothetical protein